MKDNQIFGRIKREVANKILEICEISPEYKNAVTDLLGGDLYNKIKCVANGPMPMDFLIENLNRVGIKYTLGTTYENGCARKVLNYLNETTDQTIYIVQEGNNLLLFDDRNNRLSWYSWGTAFEFIFNNWWLRNSHDKEN